MKRKLMAAFITASLTAGCIPSRVTYLEPSGRGHRQSSYPCAPTINNTLSTAFPEGIYTRTSSIEGTASIAYIVPKGTRLELTSKAVSVVDRARQALYSFEASRFGFVCGESNREASCGEETEAGAWIEGDTYKDGSLFGLAFASRRLYLSVGMTPALTDFTLTPPDMIINGVRIAAEPVTFRRVTRTAWSGICQ